MRVHCLAARGFDECQADLLCVGREVGRYGILPRRPFSQQPTADTTNFPLESSHGNFLSCRFITSSKQALPRLCWYRALHVCEGPFSGREVGQRRDRRSSNMDFRGDISGSSGSSAPLVSLWKERTGFSYTFIRKPLHYCKCPRIVNILHDQPIDCLLVFAVNPGGFYQFRFDPGNGIGVVVRIEVYSERVNHLGMG